MGSFAQPPQAGLDALTKLRQSDTSEKGDGLAKRMAALAGKDKKSQNADQIMTRLQTPEWLELLFAVTRISELQKRVSEEREERSKETYQNPYTEVFNLVSSMRFECFMAVLIVLNCMMIGLEISLHEHGDAMVLFEVIEHIFVVGFFVEWCLRMCAYGWVWFFELPNAIDTFIVFGTGVFPLWILRPLGVDISSIRVITALRALRLVRLVRAVRLIPEFKELWLLIQGLVKSVRPLLWTGLIAVLLLYIFGVAATELIGRQRAFEDDEYVQELFGDPLRSMFTLLQVMTLDTWGSKVARPIMEKDWWMCLFFIVFIMIAVFVFWNLITAVIVENAMSIVNEDSVQRTKEAEVQKKRELQALADLFLEIDADGSGEISTDEFFSSLKLPKVKQLLDLLDLKPSEMEEIWMVLDDGDGVLTIREFTNGLRRMKGEAKAKDISDIIKRLRHTSLHHADLVAQVRNFNNTVGALEHDIERIQSDTGELLGLFQEMYHRLQTHVKREEGEDRVTAAMRAREQELEKRRALAEAGEPVEEEEEPDPNSAQSRLERQLATAAEAAGCGQGVGVESQ